MELTKRVKIVTGLKCNIQCVFCYYRDNLHAPNRKFEEIRRDLLYARNRGISEVDFSGGEPTVHPDLPRLIEEAKSIGMEKVCIISNGLRLSNRDYAASLKSAGVDEILFSVHGSGEKTHDEITRIQGSFKKISQAISNAVSEGIIVRTNTVVNRINCNDLLAVGNFLIPFHPVQMNFITINDWCFAKNLVDKLMLSYSEISPRLKEACDLLSPHVRTVNVRYIPFCFMKDYERFVCNHRQVKFDPFEWVPRVRARLEIQNNFWRYLGILGYGYFAGGVFRKTFRMPPADVLDESVVEALRHWYYKKSDRCRECSLELICDGVEKTYADQFGLDELNQFVSEKITDPVFFRKSVGSCNNISHPDIEEGACHL
jgi:sulfatase maturation enzyme AslB (radical SAM superfamily)